MLGATVRAAVPPPPPCSPRTCRAGQAVQRLFSTLAADDLRAAPQGHGRRGVEQADVDRAAGAARAVGAVGAAVAAAAAVAAGLGVPTIVHDGEVVSGVVARGIAAGHAGAACDLRGGGAGRAVGTVAASLAGQKQASRSGLRGGFSHLHVHTTTCTHSACCQRGPARGLPRSLPLAQDAQWPSSPPLTMPAPPAPPAAFSLKLPWRLPTASVMEPAAPPEVAFCPARGSVIHQMTVQCCVAVTGYLPELLGKHARSCAPAPGHSLLDP